MSKHAPGAPNPAAEVEAFKAARPSSYDALVATKPIAKATNVADDKVSVAAATVKLVLASAASVSGSTVTFVTSAQFAALDATTKAILAAQGFAGKPKQAAAAPGKAEGEVSIFVGLGDVIDGVSTTATAYLALSTLRYAIYVGVDKAKTLKAKTVTVVLPSLPVSATDATPTGAGAGIKPVPSDAKDATPVPVGVPASPASSVAVLDAAARLVILGNWKWDKYWKPSAAPEKNFALDTVTIAIDTTAAPFAGLALGSAEAVSALTHGAAAAESVVLAREYGNERCEVMHTAAAAALAKALGAAHSDVIKVRVLEHEELLSQGYNMITAVGQAAVNKARLVAIEYNGFADAANSAKSGSDADYIAYVGKGVVFDTGGLNLKPTGFIETMQLDKCGSAAVLGTMRALATLRPAVKVVGILALAENAIDAASFKPYCILDTHQGSVQNMNTDAEGRLCLADALTFVQNEYRPTHIVDIATLTGACAIALGEHAAGLFANSDEFASALAAAGGTHGERLWRLPIFQEHHDEIVGEDADLSSMGVRMGGACSAAAFLERFIQAGVQWAHLDIAGPGMGQAARGPQPKNATGFGAQTMIEYALAKAAANV